MTETERSEGSVPRDGRRTFFYACFACMGAAASAAVVYPIAAFLQVPRRFSAGESLEVADADVVEGQALYREHRGEQVIVLRVRGEVEVFNASCPHLGCLVTWDPVGRVFRCPCHGAAFDESGAPAYGPVNQPLSRFEYSRKDGKIVLT